MDLGAGRRGVDMGPSAIRLAGLNGKLAQLGYQVEDLGNVQVDLAEHSPKGPVNARYLPQIAHTCERVAELVEKTLRRGVLPLVLGGDHSVAMGTVAGVAKFEQERNQRIGMIWIDAHADSNTPETSPSGNVHGMPVAALVGKGPKELTHIAGFGPKLDGGNVAIIGLRDVDEKEKENVRGASIAAFTMRDIDERGMRAVMQDAIARATQGTAGFHLSFDMDAIDPVDAPGVGTPVRGGITYREAHLIMEIACDSGKMLSMEVVEVNPVLDTANRTALLAVELISSALGKRIL